MHCGGQSRLQIRKLWVNALYRCLALDSGIHVHFHGAVLHRQDELKNPFKNQPAEQAKTDNEKNYKVACFGLKARGTDMERLVWDGGSMDGCRRNGWQLIERFAVSCCSAGLRLASWLC